jgi:hypothetical protein
MIRARLTGREINARLRGNNAFIFLNNHAACQINQACKICRYAFHPQPALKFNNVMGK